MGQVKRAKAKPGLVFWLPPEEAARRFGVARDELTREVRAGRLTMRAKVAGGELVATLCSTDLIAVFGMPAASATKRPVRDARAFSQAQTESEVTRLYGDLVTEREAVRLLEIDRARLAGQLDTAGRVERGLQRYADRLESKLDEAEVLRLNLARAVGQLEAEALRLRAQLERSTPPARMIEAKVRAKKRRWFGR